jgi:hypothetical protein
VHSLGFTPLFAAIAKRQWETARLIMAIAKAQYAPEGTKEKFSIKDIALGILNPQISLCVFIRLPVDADDDDADDDSDDSENSDTDTTIEQVINFTDVANRPSAVRCQVKPSRMLHQTTFEWPNETKAKVETGNLVRKVIFDNDLEAFVNILDLYKFLPEDTDFGDEILGYILEFDRADMLDEHIRRTGCGIDAKITRKDGETGVVSEPKGKLYLGLSVHGKKRADLARKNDPNAIDDNKDLTPLLWRAAMLDAQGIVGYLAGDRPLAAYRFYSATHGGGLAERLRSAADLDKVLPLWLGWSVSPLNESPLTAAILGNSLDLVKEMFAKFPRLMASSLHERCVSRSS